MSSSNKCAEFIELLDAYHDGELEGDELLYVEKHLANCFDCGIRLKNLASMASNLKAIPKMSLGKEMDFSFLSNEPTGVAGDCQPYIELLDAYHDGELDNSEVEYVSKHLADCASCNKSLRVVQRLVVDLKTLAVVKPSRDILESMDFSSISITSLNNPGCDDVVEYLDAYHDAELSSIEKIFVEKHLHVCDDCQGKLSQIQRIQTSLQSLPRLQPERNIIESFVPPAQLKENNVVPLSKGTKFGFAAVAAAAVALIFTFSFKPSSDIAVKPSTKTPSSLGTNNAVTPSEIASTDPGARVSRPLLSPTVEADPSTNPEIELASNAVSNQAPENNSNTSKNTNLIAKGAADHLPPPPPAHKSINLDTQDAVENVELAIIPDSGNGAGAEALGIGTDEDGLYDIKI